MDLKKQIEKKANTRINELLSNYKKKILVIDQSIVAALGTFIHANILRNLNYSNWYKLTNYETIKSQASDNTTIIILANPYTHYEITSLICAIIQQNIHVDFIIAFIPCKKCITINKIINNVRLLGFDNTKSWAEMRNLLFIGKITLEIQDLDIMIYPLNRDNFYSLEQQNTIGKIRLEGDVHPLNITINGILEILDAITINSKCKFIGIGQESNYIATQLYNVYCKEKKKNKLNNDSLVKNVINIHEAATNLLENKVNSEFEFEKNKKISIKDINTILPGDKLNAYIFDNANDDSIKEDMLKHVNTNSKQNPYIEKSNSTFFNIRFPSNENLTKLNSINNIEIEQIICIDRSVDWQSAFIAPSTYESLIDLNWNLNSNTVHIESEIVNKKYEKGDKKFNQIDITNNGDNNKYNSVAKEQVYCPIILNDKDEIYNDLRDLKITDVVNIINSKAAEIKNVSIDNKRIDTSTIELIKQKEKKQFNLNLHLNIATHIITEILDSTTFFTISNLQDSIVSNSINFTTVLEVLIGLAWHNTPLCDVLRLLCLLLLVNIDKYIPSNISKKLLNTLVSVYGYNAAYQWFSLEMLGLIRSETTIEDINANLASEYKINQSIISINGLLTNRKTTQEDNRMGKSILQLKNSSLSKFISTLPYFEDQTYNSNKLYLINLIKLILEDNISFIKKLSHHSEYSCKELSNNSVVELFKLEKYSLLVFPHFITYNEIAAIEAIKKLTKKNIIIVANEICSYRKFFANLSLNPLSQQNKHAIIDSLANDNTNDSYSNLLLKTLY